MNELLIKILAEPQATLALCALIISLISLLLAVYSSFQNRKNNRLGVRPLACVLPKDYENKIAVIIQNKGTGPLITKRIKFVGDNNRTENYLIDFMPSLEKGYFWSTFSKASSIVLRPSEEKILLEFDGDITDPKFIEQRNAIRHELSKIEINIKYKSIYNEWRPFKLCNKLKWYNREK